MYLVWKWEQKSPDLFVKRIIAYNFKFNNFLKPEYNELSTIIYCDANDALDNWNPFIIKTQSQKNIYYKIKVTLIFLLNFQRSKIKSKI